jgi:CPA2 family monovalent cation:H+ antiporter-2
MHGSAEAVRWARELNPRVRVLARSTYLRDTASLRAAGADDVFSGEAEVALTMALHLLQHLGATPEQIDRERERVHRDLIGEPIPIPAQAKPTENTAPSAATISAPSTATPSPPTPPGAA